MRRSILPLRLHPACADQRGATAVEFALLAPVFIALVMAIIAFGVYFGATNSVQQIAADATRSALAGLDTAERQSLATAFVNRHADNYAFVARDRLRLDVRQDGTDPDQFTVVVVYDASALPVWNLFSGLPLPSTEIRRVSTIRNGGL